MVQFITCPTINRSNLLIRILPFVMSLLFGFWLGASYAGLVSIEFYPYLKGAVIQRISFFGCIAVHVVPLILSGLILRSHRFALLYPLAASKAFSFSFCVCAVGCCFGSAGWLIRWLLLFSASCNLLTFTWLWLRCFSRCGITSKKDLIVCSGLSVFIGLIDYFMISPFLISVFDYL